MGSGSSSMTSRNVGPSTSSIAVYVVPFSEPTSYTVDDVRMVQADAARASVSNRRTRSRSAPTEPRGP